MLAVIRLAWRKDGKVLHLALPAGDRLYESCSRLAHWPTTRLVLDPDTQQLTPRHYSGDLARSGRPAESTWLGDERIPPLRLCSVCRASWENRTAWINENLAAVEERSQH